MLRFALCAALASSAPACSPVASKPAREPRTVVDPVMPLASEKAASLSLSFVGDVIFGRYRNDGYNPIPQPGHAVFGEIQAVLTADVVVGNLETPVVRELPTESPIHGPFRFGASPEHARYLVDGGFTAVSLANNHWLDQLQAGIEQTPVILRELGIVPLGAVRSTAPVFRVETIEKNGWRIGFVAITTRANAPVSEALPTMPYLGTTEIAETIVPVIAAARAQHDLIVVLVHWGQQYADAPDRAQINAAHALIDSGADLVIGHHPHVLQGIERYRNGIIAYSLGNFLFDNTSEIERLTGVLRVEARAQGNRIDRVVFHPAYMRRTPVRRPVPATGAIARMACDRIRGRDLSALSCTGSFPSDSEGATLPPRGTGPAQLPTAE